MARCALSFWNVRPMKRDVLPAAHTSSALPVQPISQDVLAKKYVAVSGEGLDDDVAQEGVELVGRQGQLDERVPINTSQDIYIV